MKKIFFVLFGAAMLITPFVSCKKVVDPKPMGDAGTTIVRLMAEDYETEYPGGYLFLSLLASSATQPYDVVDVRRLLPNSTELNKELHVKISNDPGAISLFNTIHGTAFEPLPESYYAANSANPLVGTEYDVTFKPGDFSKFIKLDFLNVSGWDLSRSYALGFTITSADGDAKVTQDVLLDTAKNISSYNKTVVVEIGPRNQWDGIYTLKGYILRAGDATATGTVGPKQIGLVTTGTYSVKYDRTHGWANQSTIGIAASVATPTYTVDPNTNLVTITSDGGPFPDGLKNADGYTPRYDPATKTFYAYATWSAAGVTSRLMSDTLVFLRAR